MITTTTLDRDEGLQALTNAVDAIRTTIKKYGGDFNEKAAVSWNFFVLEYEIPHAPLPLKNERKGRYFTFGSWGCHNLSGILQGSRKCQTGLG